VKSVACPNCGKAAPYDPSNKWRPFCSERCRTIDLGAWATESYRVATDESPEDAEQPSPKPRES
jgi:endogenous inhibitor of DNA gyrase (YacG/DUF329 family)